MASNRRSPANPREPNQGITPVSEPDIRAELSKVEAEPLLPIEKKLIGWSLGIGIASLIILVIINRLFPAAT